VLRYRWTTIACGYFAAVLLADLLTTTNQSFTGLLALIPVLLALEWSPLVVVLGSAPLLIVAASDTLGFDHTTTEGVVIRSIGVAVGVGIGAYIASYREHHTSTLSQSRAAAVAAQEAILPNVPHSIGPFRFACAYRSAADESLIGGDFYKVIPTDFGARLIVGDVRGKGLGAIAMTAAVLGCFREWAPEAATLKDVVARLDARVVDKGDIGDFVTAIVATLDENNGLEMANCGHPSPIHFSYGYPKGGVVPERRATPLGLAPAPPLSMLPLSAGDRLLFFTDGLIECRDADGAWIELDEALIGTVGSDPLEQALSGLLGRLEERAEVLKDDVALLLVEFAPYI
jgi:sigma-B regulation protein RsbU (phosphoserine phosphatase)